MSIIRVHDKDFEPYLPAEQITEKIRGIASKMDTDYAGKKPLFVAILNGSFMFASDLFKAITIEAEICFIKLASYKGTKSTGQEITAIGLDTDMHGRHVFILDGLLETGKTLREFVPRLAHQKPASLKLAGLLHTT